MPYFHQFSRTEFAECLDRKHPNRHSSYYLSRYLWIISDRGMEFGSLSKQIVGKWVFQRTTIMTLYVP
jgi:hypothetical protein